MKDITLYIHKTFFVVKFNTPVYKEAVDMMSRHLTSYKFIWNRRLRRLIREKDKDYYSYDHINKSYRYTINLLRNFLLVLGRLGATKENIIMFNIVNKNVIKIKLDFNPKYILRDYQEEYKNILISLREEKPVMLVDLHTGGGKGVISSATLCELKERIMILVLPKYVDKWKKDIREYTNIRKDDVYYIQGGSSLRKIMNTPSNKIKYKCFIASIRTMQEMVSAYEDREYDYDYPMFPQDLCDHLGIGVILNDETHQHFHAMMKISLYMNVNQLIGLSATLDSNRPEMRKLYNHMFPDDVRVSNIVSLDRYCNVKVIEYRLESLKNIKYTIQGYNHIVYEESIMKNRFLLTSYFRMLDAYVKESYIDRREKKQKLLIFIASVRMCTLYTNHLKSLYPKIDIRRYVQDDPYDNILKAEISISTINSASTAIDIPNLITVINTVSMASLQANIQSLGRLRKIKDVDVWYYYLYTPMIPNQKQMHKIRRDTIKNRVKQIVYDEYPHILRTY